MRRHLLFLLSAALACAGLASAQEREADARTRVQNDFDSRAPKVGDSLPDVELYAADGKSFQLRSLRGQYTVLVFGCLT